MSDDRITCAVHCARFNRGICGAAANGVRKDVGVKYAPIPDFLRRCEYFKPYDTDPDQRAPRQRWPDLWRVANDTKAAARADRGRHARNAVQGPRPDAGAVPEPQPSEPDGGAEGAPDAAAEGGGKEYW